MIYILKARENGHRDMDGKRVPLDEDLLREVVSWEHAEHVSGSWDKAELIRERDELEHREATEMLGNTWMQYKIIKEEN